MSREETFGSISLIGRGVPIQGALKMSGAGISWKKAGGGRSVEIAPSEIEEIAYTPVPGGVVLTIRRAGDKEAVRLRGFRASDLAGVKELVAECYAKKLTKREAQTNGRNWGEVDVDRSSLTFTVDGKTSFEVNAKDIASVNLATKHEVVMEFHMDDTVHQASKDALVEMSFYVPPTSSKWGVDQSIEDNEDTGAKNLMDKLLTVADVDDDAGEAIAEFEGVSLVAPRGKVDIEVHATHVRLLGSAADFKIQYSAVQRVFLLPKPNGHQTFGIIHLDPPIRKGQTFYPHIVATFNANEELEIEPALTEEQRGKFEKLEEKYDGPSGEVFVRLLKAVAGCKLTRQGTFASPGGGSAVKASNKAEVGLLFPMEKSFFYLPKPPLLLHYADVDSIEFERHSGAGAVGAQRTFDILVSMKTAAGGAQHQFHGIPKQEFQNLVNFLTAKQLKIVNVDAQARVDQIIDDEEEEDHHAARLRAGGEDSGTDEDFAAGSDSDGGEATDESGSDDDDDSDGGGDSDSDAPKKKKAKKSPAKKAKAAAKGKGGKKGKKAKKDPNAPKRPLSSYMIFAGENRGKLVEETPGMSIGEIGKALGAKWKEMTAEEKVPYEDKAKEVKAAYAVKLKEYEATKAADKPTVIDDDDDGSDDGSDDDDDGSGSE